MKKTIRLSESDLHRIIRECVNQLNETDPDYYGDMPEPDSENTKRLYDLACKNLGKEKVNAMIVASLSDVELDKCLDMIYHSYNFREWEH